MLDTGIVKWDARRWLAHLMMASVSQMPTFNLSEFGLVSSVYINILSASMTRDLCIVYLVLCPHVSV